MLTQCVLTLLAQLPALIKAVSEFLAYTSVRMCCMAPDLRVGKHVMNALINTSVPMNQHGQSHPCCVVEMRNTKLVMPCVHTVSGCQMWKAASVPRSEHMEDVQQ